MRFSRRQPGETGKPGQTAPGGEGTPGGHACLGTTCMPCIGSATNDSATQEDCEGRRGSAEATDDGFGV